MSWVKKSGRLGKVSDMHDYASRFQARAYAAEVKLGECEQKLAESYKHLSIRNEQLEKERRICDEERAWRMREQRQLGVARRDLFIWRLAVAGVALLGVLGGVLCFLAGRAGR